jgi:SAM-dependent methyltransferase
MISETENLPDVLDACCGSRKFWFDPEDPRALYIDQRAEERTVVDQKKPTGLRRIVIAPDQVADFRALPFADESFSLVVFDPPHIRANRTGKNSRMAINYGTLGENWREDLAAGFRECFRVLRPHGTLVFKWAETNIRVGEVLALAPQRPLFGNRMPKLSGTHWVVFMKLNGRDLQRARTEK